MSKKKVCKRCKLFYEGSECPSCHDTSVSTNWKGRIAILDTEKSDIAKKLGVTMKGEYAIKVR